jgi:hypothetical protein
MSASHLGFSDSCCLIGHFLSPQQWSRRAAAMVQGQDDCVDPMAMRVRRIAVVGALGSVEVPGDAIVSSAMVATPAKA